MFITTPDVLRCVLSYLPLQSVLRNKRVCKQWNTTISDPLFLRKYFPNIKCHHLPLLPSDHLISLINSYAPDSVRKFSLHGCRLITDSALNGINVRFNSISLKPDGYAEVTGASSTISRLQGPAEIKIRSGLGIETTFVFSSMVGHNLTLRKLDLKGFTKASCSDKMFISSFFFKMLGSCTFLPNFHLDLRGETWLSGDCLQMLENKNIVFSYLALPSSEHNFCLFVKQAQFASPCEIVTEWPMTENFLKVIIQNNLLIKRLFIDESIPEETICQIFESHLASPCKVTIPPTSLSERILEIILRKKIVFEKLFIKDLTWKKVKPNNHETYRKLFSEVVIKFLQIEGIGTETALLHTFPKTLKENFLRRLKIIKDECLFHEVFNLAKSALLSGERFSLSLNCTNIIQDDINGLVKPNLKFQKLELNSDPHRSDYNLDILITNGSLDKCEELYLNASCQNHHAICVQLAARNVNLRKLRLHVNDNAKAITKFLGSVKRFPLLNTLIINGLTEHVTGEILCSLMSKRPNLNIQFEKYDAYSKK